MLSDGQIAPAPSFLTWHSTVSGAACGALGSSKAASVVSLFVCLLLHLYNTCVDKEIEKGDDWK